MLMMLSDNIAVATQDMDKYGEVYNVGTGKSIFIIDLAKKISDNIEYVAPRDGEARYSCADITKIHPTMTGNHKNSR